MANKTEQIIRERVDAFVDEIAALIRTTALENIQEALGVGTRAPRAKAAAPATTKSTGAMKPKKRRGGKRIRRTADQVEALAEQLREAIIQNPGSGLGAIASGLGEEIKDVRRPVHMLIEAGRLRTTGQRRGMRYFAAGRGSGKKG